MESPKAVKGKRQHELGCVYVDDRAYGVLTYEEVGYCRLINLSAGTEDEAVTSYFAELAEVCDRIAWDEEARVIVLSFDGVIKERGSVDRIHSNELERSSLVEPVAKLKQPVIAAVRGNATDVGLELALACDIRIGTKDGHFGFPQIREGRIPSSGGTQRLPRLIGYARAMQMILTGELIGAGEAKRIGLLNRVASSETLTSVATELAQDMAKKSPLSLSYAKEALYTGRDLTLDQGLRMELDLYLLLFTTFDRTEGITAFREKREPEFRGS